MTPIQLRFSGTFLINMYSVKEYDRRTPPKSREDVALGTLIGYRSQGSALYEYVPGKDGYLALSSSDKPGYSVTDQMMLEEFGQREFKDFVYLGEALSTKSAGYRQRIYDSLLNLFRANV